MTTHHSQKIKTAPDQYTSVTPWIIARSTNKMIDFLKAVFDAQEIPNSKIEREDGVVIHVVVKIGNAMVMLFDTREGWGPTPTFLNIYVEDVEQAYRKALEHGATSVTDITTLWFGEKVCRIMDPFGNLLWINQRIEEFDFTDMEQVGQRASTPDAIKGITYIQQSLDESLRKQRDFFKGKR
jgi:PhnB protein